jgi:hypothetical protein
MPFKPDNYRKILDIFIAKMNVGENAVVGALYTA